VVPDVLAAVYNTNHPGFYHGIYDRRAAQGTCAISFAGARAHPAVGFTGMKVAPDPLQRRRMDDGSGIRSIYTPNKALPPRTANSQEERRLYVPRTVRNRNGHWKNAHFASSSQDYV